MTRNKRIGEWIAFLLGIGLILFLIQQGHDMQGKRAVFPSAEQIFRSFTDLLSSRKTYARIGTTLIQVIQSIALSAAAGMLLGMAEGLVPFLHSLVRPMHTLLRSMPMILLAMIMMVITRFSKELMPLLTGCLVLIPMISEAGYEGCVRIDSDLIDVYRLDSRINPGILFRVYLPLTGGYMKQAFVNACGMGVKVVVTAEYLVQTVNSLGQAVYDRLNAVEYADLFAYILIMVLLVLILTGIPAAVIRIAGRKHKEEVTNA